MTIISLNKLEKPIPYHLRDMYSLLKDNFDQVTFRWFKRKVPHILVTLPKGTFSICYFGKNMSYRVFFPYPSNGVTQTKRDFHYLSNIVKYLKGEIYGENSTTSN